LILSFHKQVLQDSSFTTCPGSMFVFYFWGEIKWKLVRLVIKRHKFPRIIAMMYQNKSTNYWNPRLQLSPLESKEGQRTMTDLHAMSAAVPACNVVTECRKRSL
jgi:hypothetical protein